MTTESRSGPPGPRDGESRDTVLPAFPKQHPDDEISSYGQSSRSVAWFEVHDYINRQRRRLAALEFSAPTLGTPAWAALPDEHPAKLSAVLNLAEAAAYSINASQVAEAEASKAIAASVDWTAIARVVRQRADFWAANPWARRAAS
jgi:hypothetical protein